MSERRIPSRGASCLGRGLKILGLTVLALGTIYFVATINLRSLGVPLGEWPRLPFYVYTTSRVTLTFDGEEITIEGTTRCRRRIEMNEDGNLRPLIFLDHVGFDYHCGPEWLAHRFEDGSALLVGAYSNSGAWRQALSAFPGGLPTQPHFDGESSSEPLSRVPPAVIWLDNAEAPRRANYYYSVTVLDDPKSRLTAMRHEAEMWAASLWTNLFTGWGVADPSTQVPAAREHSPLYDFIAHHAVEIPRERWAKIDGLEQALSHLSEPTLLRPENPISGAQFLSLNMTREGMSNWRPPRLLQSTALVGQYPARGDTASAANPQEQEIPWMLARPVLPETSSFKVFQFDESLPRGAVGMFRRTSGRLSDPAQFIIGNMSASGPYAVMWFGGFLFDPASGAIYSLEVSDL